MENTHDCQGVCVYTGSPITYWNIISSRPAISNCPFKPPWKFWRYFASKNGSISNLDFEFTREYNNVKFSDIKGAISTTSLMLGRYFALICSNVFILYVKL